MPRTKTIPSASEAKSLARLISAVDEQGKREMESFLSGGIKVADFMPYLKKSVARLLDRTPANRVKPTTRVALLEFASRYGKTIKGDVHHTIHIEGSFDLGGFEGLVAAHRQLGIPRSEFIRLAVAKEVARVLGTGDDG